MKLHRMTFCSLIICVLSGSAWAQRDGFTPEVQSKLERLKDEPTIKATQRAALKFFNIDASGVKAMRSRAAMKGLMPQFEARYRHNRSNLGVDTRNTTIQDDPFLFDSVDGQVHEIQLGLRWNLPSLIFNAEVLDVGSLAVLQEGVLKEVTRLYYTRRRLQIDLILSPPQNAGTRMSKELRIDELTAMLDAMTGELFSRKKKSQRVRSRTRSRTDRSNRRNPARRPRGTTRP